MTYSVNYGMGARGVPEQVVETFQRLADQQRGRPERAMLDVLRHYGGGPLWIVEHIGDLIHRMSQGHAYDSSAGQEYVLDKAAKSLRTLRHRYDFRREHEEVCASNACFSAGQRESAGHRHGPACQPVHAAYRRKLDALLLDYANEHRKLPVYNRPQQLAQEAAIALGEQRFENVEHALEELLQIVQDDDRWVAEATACQLDANGEPVPLQARSNGRYTRRI